VSPPAALLLGVHERGAGGDAGGGFAGADGGTAGLYEAMSDAAATDRPTTCWMLGLAVVTGS